MIQDDDERVRGAEGGGPAARVKVREGRALAFLRPSRHNGPVRKPGKHDHLPDQKLCNTINSVWCLVLSHWDDGAKLGNVDPPEILQVYAELLATARKRGRIMHRDDRGRTYLDHAALKGSSHG